MKPFLSARLAGMTQSEIRNMTRECERVGGINLGQGLGDLPTPPLVRDGAIQAIQERRSMYSFPEGVVKLRRLIAEKLRRDNGIEADPQSQIVVTVGSSGGFACTIMGCLNPGDGIILLDLDEGKALNAHGNGQIIVNYKGGDKNKAKVIVNSNGSKGGGGLAGYAGSNTSMYSKNGFNITGSVNDASLFTGGPLTTGTAPVLKSAKHSAMSERPGLTSSNTRVPRVMPAPASRCAHASASASSCAKVRSR